MKFVLEFRILGWDRLLKTAGKVRKYFNIWNRKTRKKQNTSAIQTDTDEGEETQVEKNITGEEFWYRLIQNAFFSKDIDAIKRSRDLPKGSELIGLQPYIDEKGLLRAKGRVTKIFD